MLEKLAEHLEPLQTYEELRKADLLTIKGGTPEELLMDRASSFIALKVVELIEKCRPLIPEILIACGKGNNGGDGFASAVKLNELGIKTTIWAPHGLPQKGAAKFFADLSLSRGIKILKTPAEKDYFVVIDAIYGAGFKGPPKEPAVLESLRKIRSRFTIAVDVPSGVEADTGRDWGARGADFSITFSFKKPGHIVPPGAIKSGEVIKGEIFLSRKESRSAFFEVKESIKELIKELYDFPWNSHKYKRGHLAIVAGHTGFEGAAVLSALGAAHSPAGLITVFTSSPDSVRAHLPEGISRTYDPRNIESIVDYAKSRKVKALVLGPGLGTSAEKACKILKETDLPAVLDADCLKTEWSKGVLTHRRAENLIFTPHKGEAAQLYNQILDEFEEALEDENSLMELVLKLTSTRKNLKGIHVLKGPATIIYDANEGKAFIVPFGEASLARGGSGDVLSGLIGGFLASGLKPKEAAIMGVSLHALASKHFKVPLSSIFYAIEKIVN